MLRLKNCLIISRRLSLLLTFLSREFVIKLLHSLLLASCSWLSQGSSVVVVLIEKVFDVFGINPSMVTREYILLN